MTNMEKYGSGTANTTIQTQYTTLEKLAPRQPFRLYLTLDYNTRLILWPVHFEISVFIVCHKSHASNLVTSTPLVSRGLRGPATGLVSAGIDSVPGAAIALRVCFADEDWPEGGETSTCRREG